MNKMKSKTISKDKCAAILTIIDGSRMTKRGRKEIAAWIKKQAIYFENYPESFSGKIRLRYLY